MKTKDRFAGFLSVAVVAGAVLATAPVYGDTHTWIVNDNWVGNWSASAAHWQSGLGFPAAGDSAIFTDFGSLAQAPIVTLDMSYQGAEALTLLHLKDYATLIVKNYLEWTDSNGAYLSAGFMTVDTGGTIKGHIRTCSNAAYPTSLKFTGGACDGGEWRTEDDRMDIVYSVVGSASGNTIKPTALKNANQTGGYNYVPMFDFTLDASGVAPIQLTGTNPLQFASSSPANPYRLTVDMASYTGPAVSIPLFIFSGGTDTDRMFAPANITISNQPVAGSPWSVVQTDSAVTLTPTNPPSTGTMFIVR